MKQVEHFGDLLSIAIGMVGALLKGVKIKMHPVSVILGMLVAGILSFSTIGLIELFFSEVSQKIAILVAFVTGWVANELTQKMDEFVNDVYEILISWIKSKFKTKEK